MSRFLKMGIIYLALMIFMEFSSVFTGVIPGGVMQNFGQFIIILLPVMMIALFSKMNIKERFKFNGFKISTIFYIFLIFIAVLPINGFLGSITTIIFGENPNGIEAYVSGLGGGLFIRWFIIAITPAICEEMMFRGLLLDKKIGLNMHILAVMSGIMFSLFHVGYDQLLYTFPLGMVFAYVTIITNSIFPAMILHLMNNSIGFLVELLPVGNEEVVTEATEAAVGVGDGLGGMFVFAIIGAVIIYFVIKKLIRDYNYDDRERIFENNNDKEVFNAENKIKTFIPHIVMIVYVILVNIAMNMSI